MIGSLSFAFPLVLVALAILPVLWLLLRAVPQAPKRTRFPGLFFLRQLRNREETPSRTPWPLLLLRMLALAALIIGLAGPRLNAPEETGSDGPVLIVLDDGWPAADTWQLRRTALAAIAAETADTDRQIWVLTTTPLEAARREEALRGPMTPEDLSRYADSVTPRPLAPARGEAMPLLRGLSQLFDGNGDIRWLSDGIYTGSDLPERQFADRLGELGRVSVYREQPDGGQAGVQALTSIAYRADRLEAVVTLPEPAPAELSGMLNITARDGRLLQQAGFTIAEGAATARTDIDLPLTLRNEIGAVRIAGERSAGAVQLADASSRRSLVGIAGSGEQLSGTLLDGGFYIRQALAPYALFTDGTIGELAASDATVIFLDDIGRLRPGDAEALGQWVEGGGVLIRFAGPTLADVAQDASRTAESELLPVPLRGGGRAFGGALTWEEPQRLGGFAEDSPFGDLEIDPEIVVRRQILARPGADTAERSWAYLADGTPLVTARPKGEGMLVLFHVTASPSWSELPVSGLFVEMLRRLTSLSVTDAASLDPDQTFAPYRVLDGFGTLTEPSDTAEPITAAQAAEGAGADMLPGFYGSPDAPLAVNAVIASTNLGPLAAIGAYGNARPRLYQERQPVTLARWFFIAAIILVIAEMLYTMLLQNKLIPGLKRAGTAAIVLVACAITIAPAGNAIAQERPPIDRKAIESALNTRLAYVITGDREIDTLSDAGLRGLSFELARRTALEPADPVGINLATDDLSLYPMLYWPVTATTPVPAEDVLARIEAFMANGGLIVFDTRDGERVIGNSQTPEGLALRNILELMNVPPLEPLPSGHVLGRSFYLMDDLPGRSDQGPVWVEAQGAVGNLNDGVTPIIIGGRDWAAAWAVDQYQRPLRPMGPGGYRQRELAFRAGINMAMVALTGNYKVDQLQAEALLDQLGEEAEQ